MRNDPIDRSPLFGYNGKKGGIAVRIGEFFKEEHIEFYRELSVSDLRIRDAKKYAAMWEKIGEVKSCVVFLIPYHAGRRATNLSVYAMPRDYHYYLRLLCGRFSAFCEKEAWRGAFMGFTDSSPLDERDAALKAGLGVLGENGLILNEKYGSFCFIGEFFLTEPLSPEPPLPPRRCEACGACRAACPTGAVTDPMRAKCLSYLSQKKDRTPEEEELVRRAPCKWGCDICQEVCPYNASVPLTPIAFFREDLVERLTREAVEEEKGAFRQRAYSWRGRDLLRRNLGEDK